VFFLITVGVQQQRASRKHYHISHSSALQHCPDLLNLDFYATSLHSLSLTSSAPLSVRSKPHHFLLNRYPLTYVLLWIFSDHFHIYVRFISLRLGLVHDDVTDSCEMKTVFHHVKFIEFRVSIKWLSLVWQVTEESLVLM